MKRFFSRLWSAAALLLAAGIIAFGIITTVGHLIAPMVSGYRTQVEAALSKALDQDVEIKTLIGRWKGYGPELLLRNVTIHTNSPDNPQLELPEIRISISLVNSLLQQDISLRRITLIAPHLRIIRDLEGEFSIAGIRSSSENSSSKSPLPLPHHLRIWKGKISYEDKTLDSPPIRLSNLMLNIRSDDQRHQIDLSASLSKQKPRELTASLDIRSKNPANIDTWDARFKIDGTTIPLKQIVEKLPSYPHQLPSGTTDFGVWGSIKAGQLKTFGGSFDINELVFDVRKKSVDSPLTPLKVKHIGGKLAWSGDSQHWVLDVPDLTLTRHDQPTKITPLKLVATVDQLRLGLGKIDLGDITALLPAIVPSDHKLIEPLSNLQPQGVISDFRFQWDHLDGEWQLSGQLTDFISQPWQDIPGLKGVSSTFSATTQQAYFEIESHDASVTFANLFRDPLIFTKLQGAMRWKRTQNDGWLITTDKIIAHSPDVKSETRLLLRQANNETAPLFLDLQTDYRDGDSSKTSRYLPVGIMGKEVVEWLDTSIGNGRVPEGSVIVRGPLADFPYALKSNGRFEVFFRTEALKLDYWPEWPGLTDISADVRFLNDRFDVWVKKAKILNSRVKSAHGWIRDLALTSPFELKGRVEGPVTDNLKLLSESPLKEDFGPMVQDLDARGKSRLAIDFAIPIDAGGKERLNGKLSFLNSRLDLKSWSLSLEDILGDLTFDLNGISGNNLTGKIHGTPIRVDIETPAKDKQFTRISAKGNIPSEQLQQRFPEISLLNRMSGSSDWTLELDIPHTSAGSNATTRVKARSNLIGTNIAAPTPFNKAAKSPRLFELKTSVGNQKLQQYSVSLDNLLNANILVEAPEQVAPTLIGLNIGLGSQAAASPKRGEIEVSGTVKKLKLDGWAGEFSDQKPTANSLTLTNLDVNIDQLVLKETTLNKVSLNVSQSPTQWNARFSSDRAIGRVTVPSDVDQNPIQIEFDKLKLNVTPGEDEIEDIVETTTKSKFDATTVPAFNINVKELVINDSTFGRLDLQTEKSLYGLELTHLNLTSDLIQFSASGYWRNSSPDAQVTTIDVTANAKNTGDLLAQLGFTQNLQDAPLEIDAQLAWPQTPVDFQSETLSGELRMQVGKGQFLDVDPGVGRVFGLFNLSALQRRLTLDFSDIFHKGFAFDSIEGNFILDSGDAYTNDFAIAGPAANINISGRIGLVAHDMDQEITVLPKISSTLPLAGAIAGGPAVGAALFLAQAIIGDSFDRITRIEYSAVGPWDQPTFTRHQAPQSSNQELESTYDSLPPPEEKDWQLPSDHNSSQYPLPNIDNQYQADITGITPIESAEAEAPSLEADGESQGPVFDLLQKLKPTGQKYKNSDINSAQEH